MACVLRSPHAHAEIRSIDTAAARAAPGVLAVYTHEDVEAAGLGSIPCAVPRNKPDGSPMFTPPNLPLRKDRVRLVGDYVAFVVAETHDLARDAAELIEVAYQPLASVTATADALAEGAPAVWPEAPDNVCFVFEQGDEDAVETAFAGADHVTRLDFTVSRVAVAPMEPRACIGEFDRFSGRYTLYTGTQGPHGVRMATASPILKVPEGELRVVSYDMGGAFGMRSGPLLRIHDVPLRREAARPAGQVDRRPDRGVHGRRPGARQPLHRRARAHPGRRVPRPQGADDRQSRGLSDPARAALVDQQSGLARGPLPHAGDLHPCDRRVHQHDVDRALSRRRQAGGGPTRSSG